MNVKNKVLLWKLSLFMKHITASVQKKLPFCIYFFCVVFLCNTAKILTATVRMYTCIAVCLFCRLPIKCKTKNKTWKIGKLL